MVIGVEFFRVKAKIETTIEPVVKKVDKSLYYINTNETPSELSRKLDIFTCEDNMLSSHVKISPLLW